MKSSQFQTANPRRCTVGYCNRSLYEYGMSSVHNIVTIPMLTLLSMACVQEEKVLQDLLVLLDSPDNRVELEQLE